MALRFCIELFKIFAIVNLFSVNFLIAKNNSLPNNLLGLFKVQIQEFSVFNWPEAIFNLYFLAKLPINKWLCLPFDQHL